MKTSQLPIANNLNGLSMVGTGAEGTVTIGMDQIVAQVRQAMGIYDKVLAKCSHCLQYGAIMCACPHCGAPIDPPEEEVENDDTTYRLEEVQYYHVPKGIK